MEILVRLEQALHIISNILYSKNNYRLAELTARR